MDLLEARGGGRVGGKSVGIGKRANKAEGKSEGEVGLSWHRWRAGHSVTPEARAAMAAGSQGACGLDATWQVRDLRREVGSSGGPPNKSKQ